MSVCNVHSRWTSLRIFCKTWASISDENDGTRFWINTTPPFFPSPPFVSLFRKMKLHFFPLYTKLALMKWIQKLVWNAPMFSGFIIRVFALGACDSKFVNKEIIINNFVSFLHATFYPWLCPKASYKFSLVRPFIHSFAFLILLKSVHYFFGKHGHFEQKLDQ